MLYNKKVGNITQYYNNTIVSHLESYSMFFTKLYLNKTSYCLITYPIFYKKISFFRFSCLILKKNKMKNRLNLNQTIVLEGIISRKKVLISVPVFSFLNTFSAY